MGDANTLSVTAGAEYLDRIIGGTDRAGTNARKPDVEGDQSSTAHATAGESDGKKWPDSMDDAAIHGLAGEFVQMIAPNTEADPAAILVQFLVSFGALIGRGPHCRVEGDQHHTNLYALLVGATAKGRKGTSWGRVR